MAEPITPEVARGRLGLVSTHRDAEIAALISAAREYVEDLTGVTLVQREIREHVSSFGDPIVLATRPIVDIVGVEYLDGDGVLQNISDARLIYRGRSVQLAHVFNGSWPADAQEIVVVLQAGYAGTAEDPYPPKLIQAILVLVQVWFEDQAGGREIPTVVADLCAQARTWAV